MSLTEEKARATLNDIIDPELGFGINDLGLVYGVDIDDGGKVQVLMTLTSPGCPLAQDIVERVKGTLGKLDEVNEVAVELTFNPPWNFDMASEEVRTLLRFMFGR